MFKRILLCFFLVFARSSYANINYYRAFLIGQYALLNEDYTHATVWFQSLKGVISKRIVFNTALISGNIPLAEKLVSDVPEGEDFKLLLLFKRNNYSDIVQYIHSNQNFNSFIQTILSLIISCSQENISALSGIEFLEPVYRFYYAKRLYQMKRIHEAHDFLQSYQTAETTAEAKLRLRVLEPQDLTVSFFQQDWMQDVSVAQDIRMLIRGKMELPPIFSNNKEEMAYWLIWHAENILSFRPQESLIETQLALWLSPTDNIIMHSVSIFYALGQVAYAKKWSKAIPVQSPYYIDVMLIIAHNSSPKVSQCIVRHLLKLNPDLWGALARYTRFMGAEFPELRLFNDNRTIALFPFKKNIGFLYVVRGHMEEKRHRWNAAEQDFIMAQNINHSDSSAVLALASCWIKQGKNIPQVILMLQDMAMQVSNPGPVYFLLGKAFEKIGYLQESKDALLDAFSAQPLNWKISNALQELAKKQGDVNEERINCARISFLRKN